MAKASWTQCHKHLQMRNTDADCLDVTGKRIHDAHGKRIWKLSRYYMWPEGGQSLGATSIERHSRNDCFQSFHVVGLSGTMRLLSSGHTCALSVKFEFPSVGGDNCPGFLGDSGGGPVYSNGRLETEYLSGIEDAVTTSLHRR